METWSSYIDGIGREGCAADPAALLRPGLELELIRQPADVGRPFSVAVHRRGVLIGYLPKPDARPVAKLFDRGGRARAFVLELRRERGLTGSKLKSIVIEIEAVNHGGEPWSDTDRAEIAGLGVDAPLLARRPGLAMQGRILGGLCAAVVAVTAWANIPELTHEFGNGGTPEPTVAMAVAPTPAVAEKASAQVPAPQEPTEAILPAAAAPTAAEAEPALKEPVSTKAQERPASAPDKVATVDAGAPAASMPLLPQAALTLPAGLAPFEVASNSNHVTVPVRSTGALGIVSALPAAALAAPAVATTANTKPAVVRVAQVAPLPPETPEISVPLPQPRPDIPNKKQRRSKRR